MILGGKYKNKYRIESTRLKYWNYADDGCYFITICAGNREFYFGDIVNGKMELSTIGKIAKIELLKTPTMRPNVELDEWVVMPNHIHAIIVIENPANVETQRIASGQWRCNNAVETQRIASGQWRCNNAVETQRIASLPQMTPLYKNKFGPQKNNLSSIIRGYKMSVKTWCQKNNVNFMWQPRFYDHIIRNEKSLMRIREYICNNPLRWDLDRHNDKNLFM